MRAFSLVFVVVILAVTCHTAPTTHFKHKGMITHTPDIKIATRPIQTDESATEQEPPYLGEFYISVYTPYADNGKWGYQTATGVTSKHLATCAVDPDVIPLGTVMYVGDLMLTAVDVGGMVQGQHIDIFYDGTDAEAMEWIAEFGTTAKVWLISEGEL